tara:strand:- start:256 stop:696 length:441 start_codon:yes stop_codon:yes gene_type:complete
MATTPPVIRQRFATAVDAIAGMSEARNPYDSFGNSPNTVAHLRFSVGILSVQAQPDDRQRQQQGFLAETAIGVKFSFRLKPKAQLTSYDDAYLKAGSLIQSLTNRTPTVYTDTQIRFEAIAHELSSANEYMIMILTFNVLHYVPLT